MKRFGTVLTFKEGTTREEAAEALRKIADVVDLPEPYRYSEDTAVDNADRAVTAFDDQYGGPVWYIP